MNPTIFGTTLSDTCMYYLQVDEDKLSLNLKFEEKNQISSIIFKYDNKHIDEDLSCLKENNCFIRISSKLSIEFNEKLNILEILIRYISSNKHPIPFNEINLDLSLSNINTYNNFKYVFNNSIYNKSIDLVDLISEDFNNVIQSLPKIKGDFKTNQKENNQSYNEEKGKVKIEDHQLVNGRKKNIDSLLSYLNIEQREFIEENKSDLCQLDPEKLKKLYEMMFNFENDQFQFRYFKDCESTDKCLWFNQGRCIFSHHPIQKRVFQTQINGRSLEDNSKQNVLLHLSILLKIDRKEIIRICELDIDEIFEIE